MTATEHEPTATTAIHWTTSKHITPGALIAFLNDGFVWRSRTEAETAPYGWKEVASVTPGRTYVVTYTDGTQTSHAPAAKSLWKANV